MRRVNNLTVAKSLNVSGNINCKNKKTSVDTTLCDVNGYYLNLVDMNKCKSLYNRVLEANETLSYVNRKL